MGVVMIKLTCTHVFELKLQGNLTIRLVILLKHSHSIVKYVSRMLVETI